MEKQGDTLRHGEPEEPSPAWQEEILANRKSKMDAGEATFVTLDELQDSAPGSERPIDGLS